MVYQFEMQGDEHSDDSQRDDSGEELSDDEAPEPLDKGKGKAREVPEAEPEFDQDFE